MAATSHHAAARERRSADVLRILRRSFATVEQEHARLALPVKGQLPAGMNGVLYRNGPGRMERGGYPYGHLFDGDGHLCRFEIADGRVHYSNRFVRTRYFEREERAGRVLYRCFGTNRPGGMRANFLQLDFKNAANTHVIQHGGRLLALYEGGPPYAVDAHTLETEGIWEMGGSLRNPFDPLSRLMTPLLPFAAHPTIDPQTGELIGFGLLPGRPNRLLTYRIDARGKLLERRHVTLGHSSFVHDALVTRHWMVFLLPQVDYSMAGILFGHRSAVGSMAMHTERPMQVLLVPRDGGAPLRFETIPGFIFHFAGGAEHADGTLHANLVHHSRFPPMETYHDLLDSGDALGRLTRLDIDPRHERTRATCLSEHAHELPRVGADDRQIFSCGVPAGVTLPFYSAITATALDASGSGASTRVRDFYPDLPGEPVPVEVDGETWLLVLVYRAREHRTELLVLRAGDLSTAARITLPHTLPPGFHGSWVAADRGGATAGGGGSAAGSGGSASRSH